MSQLHSQPLVVSDDPFECVSGIPVKGSSQVKKGMRCISFCVTQQLLYPWIDLHERMFFCNISFSISGYNLQSEMGHFTWTGSRKYRNWKSTMCLRKSTSFRTRSFRLPVLMFSTSGWRKIDNFRFVWTVYIPQASFKSAHGFGRSSCVTHKMNDASDTSMRIIVILALFAIAKTFTKYYYVVWKWNWRKEWGT